MFNLHAGTQTVHVSHFLANIRLLPYNTMNLQSRPDLAASRQALGSLALSRGCLCAGLLVCAASSSAELS